MVVPSGVDVDVDVGVGVFVVAELKVCTRVREVLYTGLNLRAIDGLCTGSRDSLRPSMIAGCLNIVEEN